MNYTLKKEKQKFDYDELKSYLDKIEIRMESDEVATYYDNKQVSRKRVSGRYEIFDFRPFILNCLSSILANYEIQSYDIFVVGGVQEIRLYSSDIEVNGEMFTKTFYLLNSSDKSRALGFSYGLTYKTKAHFITKMGSITKKHYKGITEHVNENVDVSNVPFDDIISDLKDIIGECISFKDVVHIILDGKLPRQATMTNINRLVKFINKIKYDRSLDGSIRSGLPSAGFYFNLREYIEQLERDFNPIIDSFLVFKVYMSLLVGEDCTAFKRESAKIRKLGYYKQRQDNIDFILGK